jgi:lipopolysaccharide export LptBFGC system permease protein LptF
MNMERIIEKKDSDILAMALMLYSVPKIPQKTDALVIMPGLGENWRIEQAIKIWENNNKENKFLLISGVNQKEKTAFPFSIENFKKPPFNLKREQNVYTQEHADHTKAQAEWIISKVKELNIQSLSLFVSPFHLLRAYSTLLKAFINSNNERIVIIPNPIKIPPSTNIPEVNSNAWDLVQGELDRIKIYQEKGDVASYEELKDYLNWLWTQPLIKDSE